MSDRPLANILYETQGLTLQSQKTQILASERFRKEVLETEERKEINALSESFGDIISELGLDNPYEPIDYDGLVPEIRAQIDGLNLEGMLEQQLNSEEIDISLTKFLINRMGQLRRTNHLWQLLNETDKLFPVFAEVIQYLAYLTDILSPGDVGKGRIIPIE